MAGVFLAAVTLSQLIMLPALVPYLRKGYQNFTIFYAAGTMVRSGETAALYNLKAQYQAQRQIAPDVRVRQAALPYNHPPFEALLFVPLTLLPYWPAYLLWTALNLILVAATLVLFRKQFAEVGALSPYFVALATLGFAPIAGSMIQGHDCVLFLFLYVLALAALERERDVWSGALLALGLFRPQLALPLVLILAVRKWRMLLGFVPVAVALAGVSVAMMGWHGAWEYLRVVLNLEKSGAGGSIVAAGMPNLRGMVAAVPGIGVSAVTMITGAASLGAMAFAMWRVRANRDSLRFCILLATIAALLVSYHALTYDMSLLLPAILLLFAWPGRERRTDQADIELLVLLFLIPRFELLGPLLSPLMWFGLISFWLFWKGNWTRRVRTMEPL